MLGDEGKIQTEIFDRFACAMENKLPLQKPPEHRKVNYNDGLNLFFQTKGVEKYLIEEYTFYLHNLFLAEQVLGKKE